MKPGRKVPELIGHRSPLVRARTKKKALRAVQRNAFAFAINGMISPGYWPYSVFRLR
jgi:hypothetical protein